MAEPRNAVDGTGDCNIAVQQIVEIALDLRVFRHRERTTACVEYIHGTKFVIANCDLAVQNFVKRQRTSSQAANQDCAEVNIIESRLGVTRVTDIDSTVSNVVGSQGRVLITSENNCRVETFLYVGWGIVGVSYPS